MLAASLLQNALQALGAISLVGFAGGVVYQVVKQRARIPGIPWWWWWGNGMSLFLVALGNHLGLLQGFLLVASALSAGAGITLFIIDYRAGKIRFRREREQSWAEIATWDDWNQGAALVRVVEMFGRFNHLWERSRDDVSIDLTLRLLNANAHSTGLEPRAQGRINAFDQQFANPPELVEMAVESEYGQSARRDLRHLVRHMSYQDDEERLPVPRGLLVTLTIRQHLTPAVVEAARREAGNTVRLQLGEVTLAATFARRSGDKEERKTERIRLDTCDVQIPDRPDTWVD
jgi:hypothetical protein